VSFYNNSILPGKTEDNYILYLIGLGHKVVRLLTHKEMYQSHCNNDGTSDSWSSV